MNAFPIRLLLAAICVAGLAAPGFAQESERRRQQTDAPRQAQPRRAAAPRSQAPARQAAPPRTDAPRAAERSQGTDSAGRARVPPANRGGSSGARSDRADRGESRQRARPRTAAPAPRAAETQAPEARPSSRRAPTSASSGDGQEQRRAVPRGSRPRGGNPVTGRAVPREEHREGRRGIIDGRRGRIVVPRGRTVNRFYYYYPPRYYPYGYGAFGLGYFYYDPYRWYGYDPHYYSPYYSRGHYGSSYGYYTGELRLQVKPRHAEVYVDGYFAGHVDDFDGIFQSLRLEEGPYRVEIVAPGYEPLEIDIRIQPGRKITYRGELRPHP